MKRLITDAELWHITRTHADVIKGLGALEAKDRPHVADLLKKMKDEWILSLKQSRTTVNMKVATDRGLNEDSIHAIGKLHTMRKRAMENLDYYAKKDYSKHDADTAAKLRDINNETIAEILADLKDIEFRLQALWGFDLDASFHEYNVPGCTCPKHTKGDPFYHVDRTCPIHNADMKEAVKAKFDEIEKSYQI
ncbi:hypothetical protein [Aeromonas phage phiWae14]|nr:hypothetical protein [Aeromonas phage phiWae14]